MKDDELGEFIGDKGHFSTMFDFSAHMLAQGDKGWYNSRKPEFKAWRSTIFDAQLRLQKVGHVANIIENHDEPRGASRFLPEHAQNEAGEKDAGDDIPASLWNPVYLSGAGDRHDELP